MMHPTLLGKPTWLQELVPTVIACLQAFTEVAARPKKRKTIMEQCMAALVLYLNNAVYAWEIRRRM